jgi:hypothetical protein
MTVPPEMETFCNCILLGMKYAGNAEDDWIAYALERTDQRQLEIVKRCLADALENDFDLVPFQRIWDDRASRLGLRVEGDVGGLLKMILDRIGGVS